MKLNIGTYLVAVFTLSQVSQAAIFTVHIKDMAFDPKAINIGVGDTIEFISDSARKHTVTGDPATSKQVILPAGAAPFESGTMVETNVFKHSFDVAGHYQYVCKFHERMGMIGTVDVHTAHADEIED